MRITKIIKATTEEYEDFFDMSSMVDALQLMGFTYLEMNFFRREDPNESIVMYAEMFDDAIILDMYEDNQKVDTATISDPKELITWVEDNLAKKGIENAKIIEPDDLDMADDGIYPSSSILSSEDIFAKKGKSRKKNGRRKSRSHRSQSTSTPDSQNSSQEDDGNSFNKSSRKKTSTRDFINKLLRVKSSNVWAYAFNPKTDEVGDMLMQFKGKNGGPGDVYIYYDVPTKLWRRLVAAPSKGHFFWEYIRNVFTYAKLTGDKRTKLANGI